MLATKPVPPYGRRAGLVPRRPEDFGAGGAFPEVHVPQYPLSMGLLADREATTTPGPNVLAVTVDAAEIVYSSHAEDLVPRITAAPDQDTDDDEYEAEIEATTARTQAALQAIVNARLSAVQSPRSRHDDDPTLIRYRPARQSAALHSERVVRVEHAQEDPVLPPKHKRSRRVPHSPPVVTTVMHSPPRLASRAKDMVDWKVPPSVSDWKNSSGYTVPLDKRVVASDGRRMQDVQVSGGFTGLSEALYVAEQKAREAVETRVNVRKEIGMKAKEQQEQALREIAKRARAERAAAEAPPVDAEESIEREELRRRQREYERRREAASGKKSRRTRDRDRDRDVSERIALGMASTGGPGAAGGEVVAYDERLFGQDAGMDSGFAADDDRYNVYSGRLFAVQPAALSSMLCRPNKHGDSDMYGGADEHMVEKRTTTAGRFKADKVFSGGALERTVVGKRDRPVEFDMPEECGEAHDDPFVELDQYMAKVKEGKKR